MNFQDYPVTIGLIIANVIFSLIGFSNRDMVDKTIMWPYRVARVTNIYVSSLRVFYMPITCILSSTCLPCSFLAATSKFILASMAWEAFSRTWHCISWRSSFLIFQVILNIKMIIITGRLALRVRCRLWFLPPSSSVPGAVFTFMVH